ncbi:MAG: hypothetical protein Q8911_00445 [Bacillota bacterium]|nr:hypothetical protein [Bacillota bacterium]
MTKREIKEKTLERMIDALLKIQEAHEEPENFNNPEGVKNTRTFYFCGLGETLELVTGNKYHYSTTDNKIFSIVEIVCGKEKVLYTTPEYIDRETRINRNRRVAQ